MMIPLTTYTVKKGDSLWSIAKKFLGDGNRYKEIQKVNGLKDTAIYPNTVLKIPTSTPSKPSYEEIGRAFEKAMNDVDNLPSVNKLFSLIGE